MSNAAITQNNNKRNRKSKKGGNQDVVAVVSDNTSTKVTISTPIAVSTSVDGANDLKRESETLKELMKRERKVKKKLNLIEASENKIKDLSEEEKATTKLINPDERRKIAEKPIVLAVHKEQTEILAMVNKLVHEEEARLNTEKETLQTAHAEEVQAAKEAGKAEGKEEVTKTLRVLLKFLRAASYRRANAGPAETESEENKAVDLALFAVYEGGDDALQACKKLGEGAEEPLNEDTEITWARIHEIAHELDIPEPEVVEAIEEEKPVVEEAEGAAEADAATTEEAVKETEIETTKAADAEIPQPETPVVDTPESDDAFTPESATPTESKPAETPIDATPDQGWAEEAHEAHLETEKKALATDGACDTAQANADNFEDVAPRRGGRGRGGWRGRGEHRGEHRGGFRGRGEHRGRGGHFRGGERGGRGGDRAGRGGEHRGGYRGRGGEHRGRGDHHHHRQHSNQPEGQQTQQSPEVQPQD